MFMVMFVLHDPGRLDEVLEAWHAAGIDGVTILESTGLHRRRHQALGARYAFAFPTSIDGRYVGHFTLLAAVRDRAAIRVCADAAASIVGDLDAQGTGVLMAWPIEVMNGMPETRG